MTSLLVVLAATYIKIPLLRDINNQPGYDVGFIHYSNWSWKVTPASKSTSNYNETK